MPANLPPQYFETEKKLKTAKTPQEKVTILEELLAIVPKHKGTEKLQALLKTKIAKLRSQSQKKPMIARHGQTFHIEKAGAGQVVLIGAPNTGKSSLIKALTNAQPDIGDYPFTTNTPSPAMMIYENIQIQLIDTPPITQDYLEAWQAEMIKGADGLLLVLDLSKNNVLTDFQNLVNKLEERRIKIVPGKQEVPSEQFQFIKKTLIAANKSDHPNAQEKLRSLHETLDPPFDLIPVSAETAEKLSELKNHMFELLNVVRVYSKIPGKKVDRKDPFVFQKGSSLMDLAKAVHKDFSQKLKYARIWGADKYQGQKVNRDYELQDEDIIELHIR